MHKEATTLCTGAMELSFTTAGLLKPDVEFPPLNTALHYKSTELEYLRITLSPPLTARLMLTASSDTWRASATLNLSASGRRLRGLPEIGDSNTPNSTDQYGYGVYYTVLHINKSSSLG